MFPYVVVEKTIPKFTSKLINKEFGNGPFRYEPGSLLALDMPQIVYLERDLFRPVTSVFEMVKNDNISAGEWELKLDGDKVQIAVHSTTKVRIDAFRNTDRGRAILLNSIYFSVVMQCVSILKQGADYDDHRWAHVLRAQCHNLNINLSSENEYRVAQALMKSPLGMLNSYVFEDPTE